MKKRILLGVFLAAMAVSIVGCAKKKGQVKQTTGKGTGIILRFFLKGVIRR